MEPSAHSPRRRRLVRAVTAVVALPVVAVLLLQVPPIRSTVVNRALRAANPWQGMELRAERVSGSVLWTLGLEAVTLTRADGSEAIRIDSVGVSWSPSALLRRRVALDHVSVVRPVVAARRDSTGALDLAAPFTTPSEEPSPWTVSIRTLELAGGDVSVRSDSSTWAAGDLRLVISDLLTGDGTRLRLDSLRADVMDPGGDFPGILGARAELSDGILRVDTLYFSTARSTVMGRGALRLPSDGQPPTDSLRFRFTADPLALGDLTPLVSGLDPAGVLTVDIDVRGSGHDLSVLADARAGDGGSVHVEFGTRIRADSVLWEGRFEAVDLRPGSVLSGRSPSERIRGNGAFRLAGPTRERLSGPVRVDLQGENLAGMKAMALQVDQTWRDGRADTQARVQADDYRVRADGWIEPLGPTPAYDLDLRSEPVALEGTVPVRGTVAARLTGSGLDLDADARLALRTMDASIGGCPLAGDGALVHLAARQIEASVHLEHCGAPVTADLSIALEGRRPWTLRRLVMDHVPVAPRDTVAGSVTLSASGSGFLDPADGFSGKLDLRSVTLEWRDVSTDSLAGTVSLRGGTWSADLAGGVAGGAVRLVASGTGASAHVREASFRGIDLARTGFPGLPYTDLTGSTEGSMDWSDPDAVSGAFTAVLRDSRVAEQDVDSLFARVDMVGGTGRLGASALLHGGRFDARAEFGVLKDSTWLRVQDARFDGIDVAAWTGSDFDTDLTGSLSGWYGPAPRTGRFDLAIDRGSRVRSSTVDGADAVVRLAPDSIAAVLDARMAGGGRLRGRFRLDADSTFDFTAQLDSLDATRLAGRDSLASRLDGSVRAHGRGLTLVGATGRIEADLGGTVGPVQITRLHAAADIADGIATLDTTRAQGSFGSLRAFGAIPLPGASPGARTDLSVVADLDDVGELAAALGYDDFSLAAATARVNVRGSGRGLAVSATLQSDGLVVRRIHLATLEGTLAAEVEPDWSLRAAEIRLEAGTLSLPSTTAEEANLVATVSGDTVRVEADVRFTERRQARGSAVLSDSLRHISVLSFEALLDDAEWALLSPVDVEFGDGFSLSAAVLQAGEQKIAAGGGLGTEQGNLYVTAEGVKLDAVASLLGFRGLGMTVSGAVTGTGTVDQPQLNGVIEAGITVGGRPSASVTLASALDRQVLQVDGRVDNASGGMATVQGNLSLEGERFADAPVNLDVVADSLALSWLLPFQDRSLVSDLGGRLTGRAEIRGTFQAPEVTGGATLRHGRLGLPTLGRPRSPLNFTGIEADLAFEDATVLVERASVRSGPGTLRATGFVTLEQLTLGRFSLDLSSQDFLAIDDVAYRAFAASDLKLSGTTKEPVLSGSVRVTRGEFFMTEERAAAALEPVELDAADLLDLEQRFGMRVTARDTSQVTFYDLLAIENLRLDFERDTWFRSKANPRMDVRFTGSLDVQKAPRSEPSVFGTITLVPEQSRIEQFGRRFDIDRGELVFSGPMTTPQIDLAASYEVRSRGNTGEEVTIGLVATGRPDNLRIDFDSDPAMDLSDIISYIATGRPASNSLQFEGSGDGYLNTAAGLAMGPIAGIIEDVAGAGLGLDVVEIEHNGLSGLTLTAGKYVSPEFYVAVRQPISFASGSDSGSAEQSARTQVSIEYEILRQLLVSLLSRGDILRVQLRWEHAF